MDYRPYIIKNCSKRMSAGHVTILSINTRHALVDMHGGAWLARLARDIPLSLAHKPRAQYSDLCNALTVVQLTLSTETTGSVPRYVQGESACANRPISGTPVERAVCIRTLTRS
jgi:hypothetical protein